MNSDLIIAVVPATIAAVASLAVSLLNRRGIKEVHILVNSQISEWKGILEKASFAQGEKAQREVQEKKEAAIAEGVAKSKA